MASSSENQRAVNEWMDLQRQCLQTWMDAQKTFIDTTKDYGVDNSKRKMEDFYRDWQRNVFFSSSPMSYNFGADMFKNQFTDTGRNFFDMMNRMNGRGSSTKRPEQVAMEWAERMRGMLSDIVGGQVDPITSFNPLDAITSMPGLGADREKQEDFNELYKKWVVFQKASFAYYQGMAKISLEANQTFFDYLMNLPEGEKPLETGREILNKWVEISEGVYTKYAHSDKYMKLYGDTINALSEFRIQLNKVADRIAEYFNLPTRKELDSLHKYVHDIKVENQKLKAGIKEIKEALRISKRSSSSSDTRAAAFSTDKIVEKNKDVQARTSESTVKGKK